MAWFLRPKQYPKNNDQREMPDGLWTKCDKCSEVIYKRQLEESLYTCPSCGQHFKITAAEYIDIIFDAGTFVETGRDVRSGDPLEFVDTKAYKDRLSAAYGKGITDALTTGYGEINSLKVSFGCMNFNFIGGSMGSVVGEKFVRAANLALQEQIPLVIMSASGGARMQEGALSLMQMAKTSAKLAQLSEAGIPYISMMTHPTTGGVTASFAMLGDINMAEPGALIGFAGPRVIEQTIRKKLPSGFQRSEFLLEHGFLDMIVHRQDLRDKLRQVLALLTD